MKYIFIFLAGVGVHTLVKAMGIDDDSWQCWVFVIFIAILLSIWVNTDEL